MPTWVKITHQNDMLQFVRKILYSKSEIKITKITTYFTALCNFTCIWAIFDLAYWRPSLCPSGALTG